MSSGNSTSFRPETLTFLQQLQRNNNRDWFNANKTRYEEDVLDVALQFIASIQEPLAEIAPHFVAVPKRVGGSLMRIYRDTRFGKDKTPYKTNIGIQFRHEQGKDVHAPGYYVHIDPERVFIGAGMWRPASDALKAIRQRIDAKPSEWQRARDDKKFSSRFELSGESLSRPPRGFGPDHPLLADLKRKDFIAIQEFSHADALRPTFQKRVLTSFGSAEGFMRFLCKSVNVGF